MYDFKNHTTILWAIVEYAAGVVAEFPATTGGAHPGQPCMHRELGAHLNVRAPSIHPSEY
jgi:hypothetical protein